MKSFRWAPGMFLMVAVAGFSQVTVEVILDQEVFLRDESLPVQVRITNRSGQTLKLGRETDWLSFAVENRDGNSVSRVGDPPVKEEFSLESSMVASRRVDLAPYFNLSNPGRYLVTATIKIPEWTQEVASKPRNFDIVRGTKLWEQTVGVPGSGAAPEPRKYILHQAQLKRLTLYVRITDEGEFKTFRLMPVGTLVSFSRPEAQVDKTSNLHLLFQSGPRSFTYTAVTANGDVIVRQSHAYTASRPNLRADEDGRIRVVGGERLIAPDDIPPPAEALKR
ncbi:MAG: hypothetical protein L0Y58_21135 [Verrucomicrobia subdivision 3 bacterium]|nr:hypothetical protein [Limisphaerales bacterium]